MFSGEEAKETWQRKQLSRKNITNEESETDERAKYGNSKKHLVRIVERNRRVEIRN